MRSKIFWEEERQLSKFVLCDSKGLEAKFATTKGPRGRVFKSRHLNHEEPKLNTQVFDLGSFVIYYGIYLIKRRFMPRKAFDMREACGRLFAKGKKKPRRGEILGALP